MQFCWHKWSVAEIEQLPALSRLNKQILDNIDCDPTNILVKADQQCAWFKQTPWSPDLHNAFLEYKVLAILTQHFMHRAQLPMLHWLHLESPQSTSDLSPSHQNHHRLPVVCPKSTLYHVLWSPAATNTIPKQSLSSCQDNKKQKLTKTDQLWHAEETHKYWHLVCQMLQPTSPGGLTYLLIPNADIPITLQMVMTIPNMEQHLLQHSKQHFSQAHSTPFTEPPLSHILGFDGLMPFGDAIFQGLPSQRIFHLI